MQVGNYGFSAQAVYREFPLDIINPTAFEAAGEILKSTRPNAVYAAQKYCVWHITTIEDAEKLLAALEACPWPVGFDFETKGWAPRRSLPGVGGSAATTALTKTGKVKKVRGERCSVTTGLSPCHPAWKPTPVTLQLSWGEASYVVAGDLLWVFADWLCNRAKLDGANITYESHTMFANVGHMIRYYRDVLAQHYWYNELSHQKARGLKATGKLFLGISTMDLEEVIDLKKGQEFDYGLTHNYEKALYYAAQDAWLTTILADVLEYKMRECPVEQSGGTLFDLYQQYGVPFQIVGTRMEAAGFPLNKSAIIKHFEELKSQEDAALQAAHKAAGRPINPRATADLVKYYYEEKGLPVKITGDSHYCLLCSKPVTKKTGHRCPIHGAGALINTPAVGKEVLSGLDKAGDALAKKIISYKTITKQTSTWVDGFWRYAQGSQYGYPSINTTGTVSGRLSAGIWLTTPAHLRDILGFDEDSNECLVGGDYSQLELRVLGHLTQDPAICAAFNTNKDLHAWSAALVWAYEDGCALEDVEEAESRYAQIKAAHDKAEKVAEGALDEHGSPLTLTALEEELVDRRKRTKKINFGIVYGMGPAKLAADLGIPVAEATEIFEVIWQIYAGARTFYDALTEKSKEKLYLETLVGRWQRLDGLASEDPGEVAKYLRLCLNKPCQCGAADVVCPAMVAVDIDLEAGGAYGTIGRLAYGTFDVTGAYTLDNLAQTPWREAANLPKALVEKQGLLGKLGFRVILQCHDEILLRGPKSHAEEARARLKELMMDPFGATLTFNVPLKVGVGSGMNWASIK